MVDVTGKDATKRTAVAAGTLRTRADVVELIATGGLPKGDALATARVAGILAAKRTSDLIPLCHQLALTGVDVDFEVGAGRGGITATVRTTDRTGVEMEALTAVSVAALTLYDMLKAVDPAARIDDIRVLRKEGGKTGAVEPTVTRSGRVVIASTRAAAGVYEDRCGPIIVDWLNERGIATPAPTVVADGIAVNHALFAAIGENVDVVITSGGTGISPTDRHRGRHREHRRLPDPRPGRRDPALRAAARADVGAVARGVRRQGPHADREPARLDRRRQGRSRRARRRARARAGSARAARTTRDDRRRAARRAHRAHHRARRARGAGRRIRPPARSSASPASSAITTAGAR